VRLWTADGEPITTIQGHQNRGMAVDISADGQWIATASEDNTAQLWSLNGKAMTSLAGHTAQVNAVTFIPENLGLPSEWGTIVVSASWDNAIKLWSLDGTLRLTLEGHEERVLDVDFYPATATHGPLLASGGLDDVVILWPLDRILETEQVMASGCNWIADYLKSDQEATDDITICQNN
jgi:WD40 repeat protein